MQIYSRVSDKYKTILYKINSTALHYIVFHTHTPFSANVIDDDLDVNYVR